MSASLLSFSKHQRLCCCRTGASTTSRYRTMFCDIACVCHFCIALVCFTQVLPQGSRGSNPLRPAVWWHVVENGLASDYDIFMLSCLSAGAGRAGPFDFVWYVRDERCCFASPFFNLCLLFPTVVALGRYLPGVAFL